MLGWLVKIFFVTRTQLKGDFMEQEKFLNETPEKVLLIPKLGRIQIDYTQPQRVYGLFDTKTGTRVKDFVKGNGKQIEFNDLDQSIMMCY